MERKTIKVNNGAINYFKYGSGSSILLAFHGFGQTGHSFYNLHDSLGVIFTVLAVEFPFHGQSIWTAAEFTSADLGQLVVNLQEQEDFTRFSLIGFSMGGKIALHLLQKMPQQVEQVILIAPDGIKTHRLFNLAVYPLWGRHLFRLVMKKPQPFFAVVKWLHQRGIIDKFHHDFAINHMDKPLKRDRIYHTWMSLRHFNVHLDEIVKQVNHHHIPLHLIYGKYDKVIKAEAGERLQQQLKSCTLTIVPKGHRLISPSLNPYLKKLLR